MRSLLTGLLLALILSGCASAPTVSNVSQPDPASNSWKINPHPVDFGK